MSTLLTPDISIWSPSTSVSVSDRLILDERDYGCTREVVDREVHHYILLHLLLSLTEVFL